MKKIFRTLLAVMVAVVMSFGVVALSACGPNDNNNNNNNNNSTVTPGLSTGNETYDSIIETELAAATLGSTITFGEEEVKVNAKVNLNGNADVEYSTEGEGYMYFFLRDWKVYGLESQTKVTDFSEAELAGFVDVNQVIEAYLEYIGKSGVELPEEVTGLISLDKADDLIEGTLGGVNYAILSLADAANAVTTADGTVTVNFNKMVYNMVQDVKAFVNGLTETTTVGDILGNATLKKYAQIVTELTTPQEIIDTVKEVAAELEKAMAGTPALYAEGENEASDEMETAQVWAMVALVLQQVNTLFDTVKPDANSSVYDYIVKVLSSQELVDMINTMMQSAGALAGTGLTKKVTEFTLGELVAMIPHKEGDTPATFASIKQMITGAINTYTSGITETVFSVSVEDVELFSLTDASLVYTYANGALTSMKLGLDLTIEEETMSIDATLTVSKTAYAATEFATLPETLPEIEDFDFEGEQNNKVQVLGLGANQVEVPAGEMVDVRVNVPEEYATLHIYSEDEGVMFYSMQDQGTEITVANYDGLSIGIMNSGDADATFTVIVEEAQAEEFDVPVLTVDEGSNFSVAAGTSMADPGLYAYYKVTIEEAGDYVISLTNLNLTSADTEEISDVSIAVSGQLEEAYGGGYDIDYNYAVMADSGVYTFDTGVYYVVIYNMDVAWHNITGTGTITISLAQA